MPTRDTATRVTIGVIVKCAKHSYVESVTFGIAATDNSVAVYVLVNGCA